MINTLLYKPTEPNETKKNSIISDLIEIEPFFQYPSAVKESFEIYLESVQKLVLRAIPKETLEFGKNITSFKEYDKIKTFYKKIEADIPTFSWTNEFSHDNSTISITTLCPAEYTQGVGRFLGDVFSRWLLPGKQLRLVYLHSISFHFKNDPLTNYYIHEVFVKVDNIKDYNLIQAHLPNLVKEIKLNIMAVQHARKIITLKPLTLDQKKIIIQENITSLLDRPSLDIDHNIFDQMHHLFIKVSAEEKVIRIKEQIAPLLEVRPQIFERDVFIELQNFVILFNDTFLANRELRHLTRIIAYKYLFSKMITNAILQDPHKRHLSIKISSIRVRIDDNNRKALSILLAINLLNDNEIIGEKHILTAISSILPDAISVPDSSITDRRSKNNLRIIYLEIIKKEGDFSTKEIKALRRGLSREIKTRIESVINPIFVHRNDEEVMRNIVVLSKQLKYVQDIPQVIITFHKQAETLISFTVILLRVLKPKAPLLQKCFAKYKGEIKFSDHEIKSAGLVRRRYKKEAHVFEMHLQKKKFLRKDYSVALDEARKYVFKILTDMLGELRDYNGGMISKQSEALTELKKLLLQIDVRNDFLLENFFYSLTPKYMQSIHQPPVLKKLFLIVLEALEHDYNNHIYYLKTQIVENHFLLTLSAINPTFKDFIEERIDALELEPSSLTSSYINIYDISCLSFILKFNDSDEHQTFLQLIIEGVKIWKDTVQKTIPSKFFPAIVG